MTKEECIWQAFRNTPGSAVISTDLKNAMDEYAKQQATAFGVWKEENTCRSGEGEWQARYDGWRKGHTIGQLYDLFIEQQNKDGK